MAASLFAAALPNSPVAQTQQKRPGQRAGLLLETWLEEGVKKAGLMAAETELCLSRKRGSYVGNGGPCQLLPEGLGSERLPARGRTQWRPTGEDGTVDAQSSPPWPLAPR